MKKQYLLGSFIIAILFVPVLAKAATADEIRAQIQSLLGQITVLQTQLKALTPATAATTTPAMSCLNLSRTLARGSRGDDVTSLQQFLTTQGLLTGTSTTGFFGSLTEGAVQRWQAQNSIVASGDGASTGYGVIGARTRAALAARCENRQSGETRQSAAGAKPITETGSPLIPSGGQQIWETGSPATGQSCPIYETPTCTTGQHIQRGAGERGCQGAPRCVNDNGTSTSQSTNSFSVSQTSGTAPLTVTFTGIVGQNTQSEVDTRISFGDGSVDESIGSATFSRTHTYTSHGTYVAALQWRPAGQESSSFSAHTVGTVTITVN